MNCVSDEIRVEGFGLAPGVLETIITLAAEQVEGVACVCAPGLAGIVGKAAGKSGSRLIEIVPDEEGRLGVAVHIQAVYGTPLPSVAREVQASVADAMRSQVGAEVTAVDVFVDGIVFQG